VRTPAADTSVAEFARQVIASEARSVQGVCSAIDHRFEQAVDRILNCRGSVLTCGVGKAGHIARKLAATFASTGTPSHFLSPADAAHGDLGAVRDGDIVLILSSSGESDEVLRVLNLLRELGHDVIAITASQTSTLGRFASLTIEMGRIDEACPLGLAPTSSTTAMLALGDALALSVMRLRNFSAEDFARFHPAGQLGRRLMRVREAMTFKAGENLPLASDRMTVGEVLAHVSGIKRRSGAVVLVDQAGKLSGIFSDGDLRRLVTSDPTALQRPIAQVMTRNPKAIHMDRLASDALAIMHQHRFDEVPVVDDENRPVGLIDIQDLVVLNMLEGQAEK
jgi:arabinose-5-phosphate isomerase